MECLLFRFPTETSAGLCVCMCVYPCVRVRAAVKVKSPPSILSALAVHWNSQENADLSLITVTLKNPNIQYLDLWWALLDVEH